MKTVGWFMAFVCACLFLAPNMAQAQATRTWVSGVGDDVNPCSRTAPCKTFAGAIAKTAAGGEIDTLDPGGFGAVTVTKAITLADEGVGEAGILVAGTNGITVNCATDPNCTVIIRGLVIDGGPPGSNSLSGIRFVAGKALIIQNCVIRNFTGGDPNGHGVNFNPSATQPEYLDIEDSKINTNGAGGASGAGVNIVPSGGGTINVTIRNTSITNGANYGIFVGGDSMSGGSINVAVTDSVMSGNLRGVFAKNTTSSTPVVVDINRSVISSNTAVGLTANGAPTTIRFGNSTVIGNASEFRNFGTMTTYGTNNRNNNGAGTGTAPTTSGPT